MARLVSRSSQARAARGIEMQALHPNFVKIDFAQRRAPISQLQTLLCISPGCGLLCTTAQCNFTRSHAQFLGSRLYATLSSTQLAATFDFVFLTEVDSRIPEAIPRLKKHRIRCGTRTARRITV